MPFQVPPATLAYWRKRPAAIASTADLAALESSLGMPLPASYVEFMKTYGAVEMDDEIDSRFDYVYDDRGQRELRSQLVAFFHSPQKALRYYEGLQQDPKIDLPSHLFPFAMDYGQGELLIELGQPTERIFYWDFATQDWERRSARLGFVANDLYEFIAKLRPYDD
jgi:hypothetical protein